MSCNIAIRRKSMPEYTAWLNMKQRCYDKNKKGYENYGGRGIRVCPEWLNSFEQFFSDVGLRPSRAHSVDRIDNDKDYAPGNVKWATRHEQITNRRLKNKYGYTGIMQYKTKSGIIKWRAVIYVDGARKYLGVFNHVSQAITARKSAELYYL